MVNKMLFSKSDGIIINKRDVAESDRSITIFFEDFGKTTTLIKGINKSKKRDKTAVDLFSLSEFIFYTKGENIIISSFSSIKSFDNIKNNFLKLSYAYYFLILLNHILVENGRNIQMYKLLKNSLTFLNDSDDERKNIFLVLYFVFTIIVEEGVGDFSKGIYIDEKKVSLTKVQEEILYNLSNNSFNVVVTDKKYSIKDGKHLIKIFEQYLKSYLDLDINIDRVLFGGNIC